MTDATEASGAAAAAVSMSDERKEQQQQQANGTGAAAAPLTLDVPPNQTLYVNNLNEKIKKEELKKSLYLIFSQYGNIVEINCNDTYKMRGQAWIVFDQLTSATRAQRELSNFLFFGKPMRITFAKAKSDVLAKLDGSYTQRAKRKAGPDERPKKGTGQPAKKAKVAKAAAIDATGAAAAPAAAAPAAAAAANVSNEPPPPPHRILFVENLPAQANDLMLGMLFNQYAGFTEARVIAGKGVAFVEFKEVHQAATAMEALQGFRVTQTNLLKITFAKK